MDFEKLVVWQRSKDLTVAIYRQFRVCRDAGFKDQITRAALSIPSNIAEGMERSTAREKARYLIIAKASCGELRTQVIIGGEIGYLPAPMSSMWIKETRELSRMLSGLINKISD